MEIRNGARCRGSNCANHGVIMRQQEPRAAATPITRLRRLPSGTRRAAGSSPVAPSSTGLIAVPRLAPSTSAKAASGGTVPFAAKDITTSTTVTARVDGSRQLGGEQYVHQWLGVGRAQELTERRNVLVR